MASTEFNKAFREAYYGAVNMINEATVAKQKDHYKLALRYYNKAMNYLNQCGTLLNWDIQFDPVVAKEFILLTKDNLSRLSHKYKIEPDTTITKPTLKQYVNELRNCIRAKMADANFEIQYGG